MSDKYCEKCGDVAEGGDFHWMTCTREIELKELGLTPNPQP